MGWTEERTLHKWNIMKCGTCSVRTNRLQPVQPFAVTLQLCAERRAFSAPVSCAPTTIPLHLHFADQCPVRVVVCVSQPPNPSCLPGGAERLRTASYNYNSGGAETLPTPSYNNKSLHQQPLTVHKNAPSGRVRDGATGEWHPFRPSASLASYPTLTST